jgi:hypothetical protein
MRTRASNYGQAGQTVDATRPPRSRPIGGIRSGITLSAGTDTYVGVPLRTLLSIVPTGVGNSPFTFTGASLRDLLLEAGAVQSDPLTSMSWSRAAMVPSAVRPGRNQSAISSPEHWRCWRSGWRRSGSRACRETGVGSSPRDDCGATKHRPRIALQPPPRLEERSCTTSCCASPSATTASSDPAR